MIDFLLGALSVLKARAGEIIGQLKSSSVTLETVIENSARVIQQTKVVVTGIEKQQISLQELTAKFANGDTSFEEALPVLRSMLREYRDFRRQVDLNEEFFAGHIVRFNEPDEYLTLFAARLWRETELPGTAPVLVGSTSDYFCTSSTLGIVFSPPSSERHLLILPDLYHEFGHLLKESLKIKLYGGRFKEALKDYMNGLQNQRKHIHRPIRPEIINQIKRVWWERWAEEVACDTLAACVVGAAYGWCNLHLCLRNADIYSFSAEHPADEARTRHIFRVLRRHGQAAQVNQMEKYWQSYRQTIKRRKPKSYGDYHAESLFVAVMEDVEDTVRKLGFNKTKQSPTVDLLNEAWQVYSNDPSGYIKWESEAVKKLKANLSANLTNLMNNF